MCACVAQPRRVWCPSVVGCSSHVLVSTRRWLAAPVLGLMACDCRACDWVLAVYIAVARVSTNDLKLTGWRKGGTVAACAATVLLLLGTG